MSAGRIPKNVLFPSIVWHQPVGPVKSVPSITSSMSTRSRNLGLRDPQVDHAASTPTEAELSTCILLTSHIVLIVAITT